MNNNERFERQLAITPLPVLNTVCEQHGLPRSAVKAEQIDRVRTLINQGRITLDQVKQTIPTAAGVTVTAPAINPPANSGALKELADLAIKQNQEIIRLRDQLIAVQHEAGTITADVANISTKVADVGNEVQQKVAAAEARIERKLKTVGVSDAAVDKAVSAAVSDAFAKFRKAAPAKRLAEVAASLPPAVQVKTAAEVFGDDACRYEAVDFGATEVQVWGHPDAPAVVPDYVFAPEHLHQALLALSDKLPDNVWLAGERGTGKTEFVTQLAARLKRPLFRVNFDEALERADFIGANTIDGGNVVWKAGIIAQAIQVHGAIILLDEIGFARAQSVAVLHSLCERSPHRALTVSETGARIPVADDVAFFCCDNSNGHGDSKGNFAGVREQNSAFIDRFSYTLEFDYLPPTKEAALIVARTDLPLAAANLIVRFANVARQKAAAGVISQPPSLRQLFAWARAAGKGLPNAIAFRNAVINKFPEDCSGELQGIFLAEINEADFIAALEG